MWVLDTVLCTELKMGKLTEGVETGLGGRFLASLNHTQGRFQASL